MFRPAPQATSAKLFARAPDGSGVIQAAAPYPLTFSIPSGGMPCREGAMMNMSTYQALCMRYLAPEQFMTTIFPRQNPEFASMRLLGSRLVPSMSGRQSSSIAVETKLIDIEVGGKRGEALVSHKLISFGGSGLWVANVALWLATPGNENRTRTAFVHAVETTATNPQWLAGQQQLTAEQSNIIQRGFEQRRDIQNQLYANTVHTRETIQKQWDQRWTKTVKDRWTGKEYQVETGYNHYFLKGDTVYGSDSSRPPDRFFTPLETVQ